jgi:hypothetical protein
MEAPRRSFINTYLDAPILEGEMVKCYEQILVLRGGEKVRHASRLASAVSSRYGLEWEVECYTPYLLPVIVRTLIWDVPTTGTSEAWRIAHSVWAAAQRGLQHLNPSLSLPHIPPQAPARARELYSQAEVFVSFVEQLSSRRAAGNQGLAEETLGPVTILGDQYSCALIYDEDKHIVVLPYEAVLMLKDMLISRANVHVGAALIYWDNKDIHRLLDQVFFWQEECLYRYGNRGYEVLKQIEPLTKAFTIHSSDPLLGGHDKDVLSRIRQVVVDKEYGFGAREDYQADALIALLSTIGDTRHLVEVFGMQRMTGHPLIDPRRGGASAAEEASRPTTTLYSDAQRLRNNWCRMYLEGFVNRSHQWPPMIFTDEGRKTQLYQLYKVRDRNLRKDAYPLTDWDHVKFQKHYEFDYYTNFTDLMDDKSISFYRDQFRATWDKRVRPRSHRRLLLEMLQREEISIRTVIEQVESGNIPEEWLIVSLYPKEREFKLAARMFSMMVFEMRVFFTALEANLADHIFPNLPQQTMTLSKSEILERFFHLSKPLQQKGRQRLYIEVDLTRWNLRWRDMPIRMIGMDLDDIFGGSGRFTFVHDFFKRCMILVRVAGYEPEGLDQEPPPQTDLLWYNHEGGFEGIAQKHWSIATYSMIDLGLAGFDLEYSLVGQADNQVVLATVSVPPAINEREYLQGLSEQIKQSIAQSCQKVGQEAKEEECLESTNVVTYSKDFFIAGCEYFLSLKAVARVFPRGASDFPTISNGVASITSASLGAAEKLKQPTLCYFLGLFHTARFLIRVRERPTVEGSNLTTRARANLTEVMIRDILCLPGSLGGLPIVTLCSFFWKGGADPCSKDYASLKILAAGGFHFLERVNEALLAKSWMPAVVDPSQLLEDPYSIPLRRVPKAENVVLNASLQRMEPKTKNKAIKELIGAEVSQYDLELKQALLAVTPFNPILLSDVRASSIVGAKEMVSRMFTMTRTIQSLGGSEDSDTGGQILKSSAREMGAVLEKLLTLPATRRPFGEVYASMEALRSHWTTEENPIKVVGVTSYCPIDWVLLVDHETDHEDGIFLTYSPSPDPWHRRGDEKPYLGTDTREKRTQHGYRIITSSASDKAYSRLTKIATQPGVSSTFVGLIAEIAKTRSSIPLERILPYLSESVGGSIAHRYQSILGDRGATVLGCGTFASHISLDSDYAGVLSASTVDYPKMLQEDFTCGIGLLNLLVSGDPSKARYLRFQTPPVLVPLPEDPVTAKYRPVSLPAYPTNSIAYCNDLSLLRITRPLETVLMTPIATGDLTEISLSRLAYQAAYRQLLNRHTAHIIADLGFGAVRLPLDLLEYRGLGLRGVIKGVTSAIARFTVDAMYSRSNNDLRWNPLPVITSLAESFGVHLLRAARHPIFAGDPIASEYFSRAEMRYTHKHEKQTVVGLLVSQVLAHLDQVSSLHLDLTELVFDDDDEDTPLLRAESIIKRMALRAVIREEITPAESYLIARRNLVQATRMSDTAGGKLNGIYLLACTLASWAVRNSKPGLASEAEAFAKGSYIKRVYRSQAQVIRALRGRATTTKAIRMLEGLGDPVSFNTLEVEQYGVVATLTRLMPDNPREDPDYLKFSMKRRFLRVYGRYAPSVYTFWPVRHLFKDQNVVILGSGNGGAKAVAIAARAVTVVCHDLRKDVALEALSKLTIREKETTVTRSTAGFTTTGGDLTSEQTWVELSPLLRGYRIIVLDAPLAWPDLQLTLSHLSTHCPGSLLVLRWLLHEDRVHDLAATLAGNLGFVGYCNIFSSNGYREMLSLHQIEWSGAWAARTGRLLSVIDSSLPLYDGISATGGGLSWNSITYRGYDPSVAEKMSAMGEQAAGRSKRTFTHDQWSNILKQGVGRLLDSKYTWVDYGADLVLNQDSVIVPIGNVTTPAFLNTYIKRWILAEYPRTRSR